MFYLYLSQTPTTFNYEHTFYLTWCHNDLKTRNIPDFIRNHLLFWEGYCKYSIAIRGYLIHPHFNIRHWHSHFIVYKLSSKPYIIGQHCNSLEKSLKDHPHTTTGPLKQIVVILLKQVSQCLQNSRGTQYLILYFKTKFQET